MTPKEFLKGGKASFTVGTLGVVVPFFAGLAVFQMFGFGVHRVAKTHLLLIRMPTTIDLLVMPYLINCSTT